LAKVPKIIAKKEVGNREKNNDLPPTSLRAAAAALAIPSSHSSPPPPLPRSPEPPAPAPLLPSFVHMAQAAMTFGELLRVPDAFREILQLLTPTERALVARVSRGCKEAVESSGLTRAGLGDLPFKVEEGFASSIELLSWAQANLCPWNETVGYKLLEHGTLEVVKWARNESSLPESTWAENSADVCVTSIKGGDLDVLKWLVQEQGFPWLGVHSSRWGSARRIKLTHSP
jgi:hypothetical protein